MATTTKSNQSMTAAPGASELPFSGRLSWSKVGKAIASETSWFTNSAGWRAWQKHLHRRKLSPGGWLWDQKHAPLTWCLPELHEVPTGQGPPSQAIESDSNHLITQLHRISRGRTVRQLDVDERVAHWLESTSASPGLASAIPALPWAVECLAWAYALPQLAQSLPPGTWWALASQLHGIAEEALAGFPPIESELSRTAALTQQLLAAELPLVLAAYLPEIKCCSGLAKFGRQSLNDALEQLLDGEGLPAGPLIPCFRPLAACWTRCLALLQEMPGGSWSKSSQTQYRFLVGHLLRLTRPDGSAMLATGRAGAACPPLLQAAVRLADDSDAWQYAAAIDDRSLGLKATLQEFAPSELPALPERTPAAYSSEWSEFALLRCNWHRKSPSLALRYDSMSMDAELNIGAHRLFSGNWTNDVHINGQALAPSQGWACVCWESDADVDYLELEMAYGPRVRLQRQILLARQDGIAVLADALLCTEAARLSLRSRYPLASGVQFEPVSETREGYLKDTKTRALILPLALPEWRRTPAMGELSLCDQTLQVVQEAQGRALFSPILIDLEGKRLRNSVCTWRQLTIAQERRILPADEAAAFRAQVGDRQWLVYRSLSTRGSRTVLGLNTIYEYVVGRFDRAEGVVDPILQVE